MSSGPPLGLLFALAAMCALCSSSSSAAGGFALMGDSGRVGPSSSLRSPGPGPAGPARAGPGPAGPARAGPTGGSGGSNSPSVINIPEGQAVKCTSNLPAGTTTDYVYRYTNGQLRHYPNPEIAGTWDSNWGSATSLDCAGLTKGEPMSTNISSVSDGKAVKCTSNLPAGTTTDYVYRYTGGKLRHYPDPTIAGTWDSNWASPTSLDCAGLTTGDPMPANISEGRAVRCTSNLPDGTTTDYVYRYTGEKLRHYPNPTIASTWDSNWTSFLETNCVGLTKGDPMPINIPENKAVKCTSNLPAGTTTDYIYRYTGGQLRHYPNPEIAGTWDSNWASPMSLDCGNLTKGEPMSTNISSVSDGKAVKCTSNLPAGTTTDYVYRYTGGQLRHYPDPTIAGTWDSNWGSPTSIDCAGLTKGDPMPANISEGRAVKCTSNLPAGTTTDYVYRYTNGQLRHYPNPEIAGTWDSNWTSFLQTNCVGLTKGDPMSTNISSIPENKAVKCTSNLPAGTTTDYVYRFTGGKLRHYPDPTIAGSWDSNWASPMSLDCGNLTKGDPMPANISEGRAVKCTSNLPAGTTTDYVYRYTNGQLRHYPNPTIAGTWDSNWTSFLQTNCVGLTKGSALTANIPEGKAVKCTSNLPAGTTTAAIYRYTNGQLRHYPNPTIAGKWDSNWASPMSTDCLGIPVGEAMA